MKGTTFSLTNWPLTIADVVRLQSTTATLQKTILQYDHDISTYPATHDVFAAYEGTTMSQTKIWDIPGMQGPNIEW